MAYAQIAQKTFNSDREDGSTKSFRWTFDEKDGTAQSYDIPLTGNPIIKMGDESDSPDKPIKTHTLEFQLKDVNAPLIDKVRNAGPREIRVTLEETSSGRTLFEGYVLKDYTTSDLYEDVQGIPVRAIGSLVDTEQTDVIGDTDFTTFAGRIDSAIDLDRALDVYTSLDHQNREGTNSFPEEMQVNERAAAGSLGQDKTGNLREAMEGMMRALGWKIFQRNGRLVWLDRYDQFVNRASINKYEGDGAGSFTTKTEDLRFTLNKTNVIEGGDVEQQPSIQELLHRWNMNTRTSPFMNEQVHQGIDEGQEFENGLTQGLVLGGDEITISHDGQIKSAGDPANNVSGSVKHTRIEIEDLRQGGGTYYYDFENEEWDEDQSVGTYYRSAGFTFTAGGGQQEQPWDITELVLAPVPDGVIGNLKVILTYELTIDQGSADDVGANEQNFAETPFITEQNEDAQVSRVWDTSSSLSLGRSVGNNFFIADKGDFTEVQNFRYLDATDGIMRDTHTWTDGTNTGTLGEIVAPRLGKVMLGEGIEFVVRLRDSQFIDLLTVFEIDDNDGNVRVCEGKEIIYDIFDGFYEVRLREFFDGYFSHTDYYQRGVSKLGGGTSTGTTNGGGGGGSTSEYDKRYFRQSKLFSEISGVTNLATARANLGLTDQTADLDLNSLSINGVGITDAEWGQITNIDATTISATQWGYLGAMDQGVATTDSVTHKDGTFTGALRGDTVRTDTGKFLAPTSYAFRNAGDTGYRNVQMAGLTATTGRFTGNVDIGTNELQVDLAGGRIRFDSDTNARDWADFYQGATQVWTGELLSDGNLQIRSFNNEDFIFDSNLFVTGGLFAKEFVVEQTRVMFDFRMAPGGGRIETISDSTTGSEKIVLSDDFGAANPLVAGAIIRIQQRTGQNSGTIIKNIVRQVDTVNPDGDNNMEVLLTDTGISWTAGTANDDVGSIEVGDDVTYEGHVSDTTLDHYIHFDISNTDIPAIRFWDEVSDVGGGFEPLRVGGMSGYDTSITGDIGIAGKTKNDGAVFWITEDEAQITAFSFNQDWLTDGITTIGKNLSSASSRIRIGQWQDDYGFIRIADENNTARLRLQSIGPNSTTGPNTYRFTYSNANGDDLVQFGQLNGTEDNFIAGWSFDQTDLWAGGDGTKAGASVRFDAANGQIFYAGLGTNVYARNVIAGFGENNGVQASDLTDEAWTTSATTVGGNQTGSNVNKKLIIKYYHRFGYNNIILKGLHRRTLSGFATASGSWSRVDVTVNGYTETSSQLESSTFTEFEVSLDTTSSGANLSSNTLYEIIIELRAQVSSSSSAGSSDSSKCTADMREDIYLQTAT